MLGNLLSHIREEKEMSKTNIAEAIGINVGHLTHIEKGERNPSQKTLRDICKAMNIPYLPVSYFYDRLLNRLGLRRNFLLDNRGNA